MISVATWDPDKMAASAAPEMLVECIQACTFVMQKAKADGCREAYFQRARAVQLLAGRIIAGEVMR